MKPIYRRSLFVLAIAAMPAVAAAQDAFTLQPTDIFAGPSSEYPQIATLPPNTEVGVAGCLSDWSWCDVTFANDRGWVWAGDLGYPYENRRVAIIEFGPRLRLPVVTFSLNTYWDAHYRSRPFFRERNVWVSRVHVEGTHGGTPPHGGTRVSGGGARPGQASAQGAQSQRPPQQAQGAQRPQAEAAQRENEQRSREQAAQRRPTEQHALQQPREEAAQRRSTEQHAQGMQQQHPREEAAQRQQPEASRAPSDQRAQAAPQPSRGMSQEAPTQRETRAAPQVAHQPEAGRAQPDRAKEQGKEERKEDRKEGNQQ